MIEPVTILREPVKEKTMRNLRIHVNGFKNPVLFQVDDRCGSTAYCLSDDCSTPFGELRNKILEAQSDHAHAVSKDLYEVS